MKSIREWMAEKGLEEASGSAGAGDIQPASSMDAWSRFSRSSFQNTMGDGSVNPTIRLKLRNKIMEIAKDFPEMNQVQLFQSIMSVVGQLLTRGSGTKVQMGGLYNKLNKGVPQGQPNQGQPNNLEGAK